MRPRANPEDGWMPQRVYRGKSKYEYRPKGGAAIPLCPLDAPREDVWEAFKAAKNPAITTTTQLAELYFTSRDFTRKAVKTQEGYRGSWKFLKKVFGKVAATKMRPVHVRAYMDKRGLSGEVAANRDLSFFYNVFAYGYERGFVTMNPCKDIKKFPEVPRDKYVEDAEYYAVLENSSTLIKLIMELSYLNGARGGDVRTITMDDLRDLGIYIQQNKTGKKQIKGWTERLEDAKNLALALRQEIAATVGVISPYLIINRFGQPYTASGLKSMWQKNKQRLARDPGIVIADWTYHDIKAKGISDFEGDKQLFSGHKSARQAGEYDRKTHVTPTLVTAERPLISPIK